MLSLVKNAVLGLIPGGRIVASFVDFVTSTFGMVLIASTIAFATGYHLRAEKAEADDLRARIAALQTDAGVAENARIKAERQAEGLSARLRVNQGRLAALQADIARRASQRKACGLSEDDARRLREIQ